MSHAVRIVKVPRFGIAFAVVVLLCAAQVGWWIVFQFDESHRFEAAARAFAAGDRGEMRAALGLDADGRLDDRFRRRRVMFAAEGAFLGLCALAAVVFFYRAMLRDRRTMRERERFLTGAAHEFKTPLATVRLGLETIQAGRVPPAKQQEYAAAMATEVDRIERGINNLLAAGGLRGDGGGAQAKQRVAERVADSDLRDDVESVLGEFESRFETAGITLDYGRSGVAAPIRRDPMAVRTVIYNLVDNALRYSDRGGRVSVQVEVAGAFVSLRVEDEGCGVPPDEHDRVFEAFYRGRDQEHTGGSGLGLHLVQEFAVLHGGRVELESPPAGKAKGAAFVVRWPLRAGAGEADGATRTGRA